MIFEKSKMNCLLIVLATIVAFVSVEGQLTRTAPGSPIIQSHNKLICLYNSSSFTREGLGKFTVQDLEPALSFCTHLVYGYCGIDPSNNKVKSLNEGLDLDQGKGHFRTITVLKTRFPHLKVLLGVGGNADPNREIYLQLLESTEGKTAFINSAYNLVKTYNFDGIDLAWQFPENKPKRIRSTLGGLWYGLKKKVGAAGKPLDENADLHKNGFAALLRDLKNAFRHDNYLVSLTVNPNVNSSIFLDIPEIVPNVDIIQLAAYDFQTATRNPSEVDYPAPIYALNERNPENNVNYQVQYWTSNQHLNANSKLVVCIPTFARTWQLEEESTQTGVPPILEVELPGDEGVQTREAGLLNWAEVCSKLPNPSNANLKGPSAPLRKVADPTKRFGNYAYRIPDSDGKFGLWVGFEDPDTAANKADFIISKNLGGACIHDLSGDDFRGSCSGEKFPILRSVKYRLK